ncbi:P-loop NTPase family protein [Vagococcus acidifermentans]|uniref:hypothetical protein n=1 Tax=Vagococcus acidifermentans TaxID=564710 RepID=UPI000F86FE03|nr:hypothetical protein [Vagococcus acidifermentans]
MARAFYHQKNILLVDEGTSSLDKENALDIEEKIFMDNQLTVTMISHYIKDEILDYVDMIYEL